MHNYTDLPEELSHLGSSYGQAMELERQSQALSGGASTSMPSGIGGKGYQPLLSNNEKLLDIKKCLEELPDKLRNVFKLKNFARDENGDEYTQVRISKLIKKPQGTVGDWLAQAKLNLENV